MRCANVVSEPGAVATGSFHSTRSNDPVATALGSDSMERAGARAVLNRWLDWRRSQLLIESYAQRGQATQSEVLSPNDRTWFQSQIRRVTRQCGEGQLALNARQWRPKTKMTRPTKGQMPVVSAPKIEPIGIGKSFGIAIPGAHHRDDCLTFANLFAAELGVLWTDARGVLARTFIAQQFFHRRGNQRQIVSQALHLIRIANQAEHAVADQIRSGLLAANHRHDAVRDDFFFRQ